MGGVSTPRRQASQSDPKRHIVQVVGGWNPDATETNIPVTDFVEMKNWRKMRPDEAETRSGYSRTHYAGERTPLAKFEYRIANVFIDVTAYYEAGYVYVLLVNPVTAWYTSIQVCAADSDTVVALAQHNTFLLVSHQSRSLSHPNDIGTYALWPSDETAASWPNLMQIGKEVCSVPNTPFRPSEITGDLLVYDTSGSGGSSLQDNMIRTLSSEDYATIRLPIKAVYANAANAAFDATDYSFWVTPKENPFNSNIPARSRAHYQHRGCYYRFVAVQEITDSSGQKFTYRSAPSTDIFVPDINYVVPHLFQQPDAYDEWTESHFFQEDNFPFTPPPPILVGDDQWVERDDPDREHDFHHSWHVRVDGISAFMPSESAFFDLQELFRAYFPNNTQATRTPYYFTAWYLGWRNFQGKPSFGRRAPYRVVVPASELKRAPMARFDWDDFANLPDNTISVEIYRTAFTEVDESLNTSKHPNFRPHRYGFVGELIANETFLDDVEETAIDFGETPLAHEGYLQGQFAGECMRIYEDQVVLGNVTTKYWLRTPWHDPQWFFYDGGCEFVQSDFLPGVGGILNLRTRWFYSYRDADGNESDAVLISLNALDPNNAPEYPVGAGFVFPRGYQSSIRSVVLYRAVYEPAWIPGSAGKWYYFREATISVNTGFYSCTVRELDESLLVGSPTTDMLTVLSYQTVQTSHDPGSVIWSERQGMFEWPQENIENEHDQNPVTHLETVIGPLYVFSDKGIILTTLQGYRDEVTRHVGCIGRNAAVKVDKIVFFLSQYGIYYVEGSGVRPFPGKISTEVLRYLREKISGEYPLKNARRTSLGYLGARNELWVSFADSTDLGGTMPARTFIYKFLEGSEGVQHFNYEFDLAVDNPTNPVIYVSHMDGSLWCAYRQTNLGIDGFFNQNNDTDDAWTSKTFLQYAHPMGAAHIPKILYGLEWTAEVHAKLSYILGMKRTDGGRETIHGTIKPECSRRAVDVLDLGYTQYFKVPPPTMEVESTGFPPNIRFITEPDESAQHMVRFKSMDILFEPLRGHR